MDPEDQAQPLERGAVPFGQINDGAALWTKPRLRAALEWTMIGVSLNNDESIAYYLPKDEAACLLWAVNKAKAAESNHRCAQVMVSVDNVKLTRQFTPFDFHDIADIGAARAVVEWFRMREALMQPAACGCGATVRASLFEPKTRVPLELWAGAICSECRRKVVLLPAGVPHAVASHRARVWRMHCGLVPQSACAFIMWRWR